VRLTRANIEKRFGRPGKCFDEPKDVECFGHEGKLIRVQFNSSGVVQNTEIRTVGGLHSLIEWLNQSVPKKARGKYRQRVELSERLSIQSVYEEEYDCVRIKYLQVNGMGSEPASITVTWK
jgi:hypothetical protein